MKLLLMRHAKSSWEDTDLPDEARPLNARGRAAAAVMASWIKDRGDIPDVVITSSATRSRETWEQIAKALGKTKAKVIVAKNLYSSGPSEMLSTLQDVPKSAKTVLMIGHQPVVSSFARKLANGSTPASCARAYKKFPTGAIAVIEPHAKSWKKTKFGEADFKRFAVPKEVAEV